jgi:molecular chaperone GrpE (heat shock protein)
MVFSKIFGKKPADDRYEVLHHKHSQLLAENKSMERKHKDRLMAQKEELRSDFASSLIKIYEVVETAKSDSFKVQSSTPEIQKLLMDVNKAQKAIKDTMTKYSIEEITASERMYDPDIHEVASYQESKGMEKGIILNTVKKGFKYKNEIVKKPKVLVTK